MEMILEIVVEASRLAYVVHDMQNDHIKGANESLFPQSGAYSNKNLIATHQRLLQGARNLGLPVFFTGHWLRDDHFDAPLWGPSRTSNTLRASTSGPEIIDELQPLRKEFVVRKGGGMSAFTGTMFDSLLRRARIETIVIAGVSTHSGVESTVRDAADRGYSCLVVSDACRSLPMEHHRASLLNIGHRFGVCGTADEALELMQKASNQGSFVS